MAIPVVYQVQKTTLCRRFCLASNGSLMEQGTDHQRRQIPTVQTSIIKTGDEDIHQQRAARRSTTTKRNPLSGVTAKLIQ